MNARRILVLSALLLLSVGVRGQSGAAAPDLNAFLTQLPSASPPVLNHAQASWLATMPLSCLDHPQAPPVTRGYLWEATYRPPDDYQKNLAFYGCFDWHSSVNSIWTLVRLLKSYPDLDSGNLIRQRSGSISMSRILPVRSRTSRPRVSSSGPTATRGS